MNDFILFSYFRRERCMSYLLNDMDECFEFMIGVYLRTTPLYNHTTKSLLSRNFKLFKSTQLIDTFIGKSKSNVSYSKMIDVFDMIQLELDRLRQLQMRSLSITLSNPYATILLKILCLDCLACYHCTPRLASASRERVYVKLCFRACVMTLLLPIYAVIHALTFTCFIVLTPVFVLEMYDPNVDIDKEEAWAREKLKSRELDVETICNNLGLRIEDLCQRFERRNDFRLIFTQRIMRKKCGSDDFVKVWGVNVRDIYDDIEGGRVSTSSVDSLKTIFNDAGEGKKLFKMYEFIYGNLNTRIKIFLNIR